MTFSDLIRLSPRLWLLLCLWLVGGVIPNVYVRHSVLERSHEVRL